MELVGVGAGPCGNVGGDAGDVISGDDGYDAGQLAGAGGINAEDAGVGMRAAEDGGVKKARNLQVVKVNAISNEEPMVLKTPERTGLRSS